MDAHPHPPCIPPPPSSLIQDREHKQPGRFISANVHFSTLSQPKSTHWSKPFHLIPGGLGKTLFPNPKKNQTSAIAAAFCCLPLTCVSKRSKCGYKHLRCAAVWRYRLLPTSQGIIYDSQPNLAAVAQRRSVYWHHYDPGTCSPYEIGDLNNGIFLFGDLLFALTPKLRQADGNSHSRQLGLQKRASVRVNPSIPFRFWRSHAKRKMWIHKSVGDSYPLVCFFFFTKLVEQHRKAHSFPEGERASD